LQDPEDTLLIGALYGSASVEDAFSLRKYSCKMDPSHGSFGDLQKALEHVIREAGEKGLNMEKPLSDFLEVTDT